MRAKMFGPGGKPSEYAPHSPETRRKMSKAAKERPRPPKHIHLPSVHVRRAGSGFDYDEDLYVEGSGPRRVIRRVVRLVLFEGGAVTLVRETFDELCPEEAAELAVSLPDLMDEGNPAVQAAMQERACEEVERQHRIAAGREGVCRNCGCSETRGCSGGCCWATESLCSRCA